MRLFIDTNIWVRLFVEESGEQFELVKALFLKIESGEFDVYSSAIVFLEVSYVLRSVYGVPKMMVDSRLQSIFGVRGIVFLEKLKVKEAFALYKQSGVKLSDCLIASQIPKGVTLVTFDEEFKKIRGINYKTPAEVI